MFDPNQLNQLKTHLKEANSVLLLLPPEPDTDSLAATLALHLSLEQSGKTSHLGCSSPVKVGDSHLFGIDQVKNNIGNQNLIISFDYQEDSAEHVSYDIDESTKRFNLRIKPKPGAKPLDTSTIAYSYTGANADLVFIFGVNSLEELGRLYSEEKEFLDSAKIVSLSLIATPSSFASVNLHTNKATCLSETITFLLKNTGINPTADAATNLYNQIFSSSNQFNSPKVTADTFELIAFLLRSGAHRSTRPQPQPQPQPQPTPSVSAAPQFFTPTENKGVPADWQGPKIYRGASQGLK